MSRPFSFILLLLLAACQFNNQASPTSVAILPIQIIAFWQPVNGTLRSAAETQPWDFIAQKGDAIRVHAISPQTITLTLQTEDGLILTQGASQIDAVLPADGIYAILVQSDSVAQYELGLSYTDRPNPADYTPTPLPVTVAVPTPTPPFYARLGTLIGAIGNGETLSGTFDIPEERHVYTFTARAGQYVGLQMGRTSGTVDPVLSLYAPSGAELATDDNSGGNRAALLRNIGLPEDGLYTVQAWGRGFSGGYQISLLNSTQPIPVTPVFVRQPTATPIVEVLTPTVAAAVSGQFLINHVPFTDKIARSSNVAHYALQGTAGQAVTIGVRPAPNSKLVPKIELYDASGALVASASAADTNANGQALISAFVTTETSIYTVFVSGEERTTGSYIVSYGDGFSYEDMRRGTAPTDQNINGEIARRGLRDVWSIDLNQGDVITVAANSLTLALDPVLELAAPDGSIVATDDNSGGGNDALIASAHAPVSGRYHLRVTGANAVGAGGYTLVWHYINLAPTPSPVPGTITLLSYNDSIPNQAYQFYPFYGQAGTTVQIRVIGQPGSGFDPVAVLLAPDATIIAQGDDSDNDLNPRFTATLPADGTYTVRVNGYLSGGNFELTVESLYPPAP
jgi:Bacterial pre-peptidase C-terminal domain